jgi:hypothetical protein
MLIKSSPKSNLKGDTRSSDENPAFFDHIVFCFCIDVTISLGKQVSV